MFAHLTRIELESILAAAKTHSVRDYMMLKTAFSHGLRASEVVHLTAGDIDQGELTVQRLKGSDCTTQPASAELVAFVANMPTDEVLFPVCRQHFWRLMKKYGAAAGIAKRKSKPHALKHTCAMLGLNGGMKINEVQRYLGHKSGSSTLKYLAVDDATASKAFAAAVGE